MESGIIELSGSELQTFRCLVKVRIRAILSSFPIDLSLGESDKLKEAIIERDSGGL